MMRTLSLCMFVSAALWACSDAQNDADAVCKAGEVAACVCPTGQPSTAVCLQDGSALQCVCSDEGEATACQPAGAVLSCECADGARGSQACLADGSRGRCRCSSWQGGPGDPQDSGALGDGGTDDDPVPARSLTQRCCHDLGSCVSDEFIDGDAAALLSADACLPSDAMLCVPDQLANPAGFELQLCRSIAGVEGRCVIDCLADGAGLSALPRDLCAVHHRCAPCFDPFSGQDSGLCNLSQDPGPREPATRFESCCDGRATCVPRSLIPSDQQALLGEDSCSPGTSSLCTPHALLDPQGYRPPSCHGAGGLEGRCLSTCLPLVARQADVLLQGDCAQSEACVPCYDPFSSEPTGVCSFPGDPGPAEPPRPFARCCGELGTCVPRDIVAEEYRALLGPDSCAGPEQLCTPDAALAPGGLRPPGCFGPGNQEGRCLADCLPLVAEQGALLAQGSCEDAHACVPCYNPLDGEATGICSLPGDPGPLFPPMPYPKCCEIEGVTEGACIPVELLAEAQASSLPQESCPSDQQRCVHQSLLVDPPAVPPVCAAGFFGEGRCVRECMVDGGIAGLVSQRDCVANDLCVPCSIFGNPTGVCEAP